MSYDIYLFQPEPGIDVEVTAERLFEDDEEYEFEDEVLEDGQESSSWKFGEQVERLVKLLLQQNPNFEVFPERLAKTVTQNQERQIALSEYDHVELSTSENGIQFSIFPGEFAISVPYWHSGGAARSVMQEIWDYLHLMEREAGYRAFDPQIGEVLDLGKDYSKALAIYEATVQRMGYFHADNQA